MNFNLFGSRLASPLTGAQIVVPGRKQKQKFVEPLLLNITTKLQIDTIHDMSFITAMPRYKEEDQGQDEGEKVIKPVVEEIDTDIKPRMVKDAEKSLAH